MNKVLAFANRLRAEGIDAVLDQYEVSPAEGWPKWMDRQIENSDFVLVICTATYYRRVMATEKKGKGLGVRWESTIMYQHLYDAGGEMGRFIPVLFEDGKPEYIPTPLRGTMYYAVEHEDYEELYRRLTGQPKTKRPVLGKLRSLGVREPRSDFLKGARVQPGKKVGAWPGESLPKDGPRVIVPFGGRVEELKELKKAMQSKHPVVAVVGMAGQGKSCLTGEWYNRGARPPEGVGLIWRKVYESGFTFDLFLDELHLYLTGEHINRQEITSTEARGAMLQDILAKKPCWVVLDGVERWLKRWAARPDAGAAGASADERAGAEPALDTFFKRASFWENGSKLLLTTRAMPGALDDNPPMRVGRKAKAGKRGKEQTDKKDESLLEDLKPDEAVELLEKLGVHGDKQTKLQAAGSYGNHAYAVHVLGLLIHELYDGNVSKWQDVEPLKEKKKNRDVGGLFERIIDNRKEDYGLLEYVAASVGPASVDMLVRLLGTDEQEIRKRLFELAGWQMVEFQRGEQADQHTVVRKVMTARMGQERVRELQKQIALWWAEREVPDRPVKIDDIRPLLKAIEHLIAARDPDAATDIFFTKPSAESYYTVDDWLFRFGYLDEDIRICTDAIRAYEELIEKESRRELRNALAMCYNNRGIALRAQGKLAEAIADYGRAIEIYEQLVVKESRRELRWDLYSSLFN